jgi:cytoskeletal protein RodZ
MKKKPITAANLRIILFVIVFLMIGVGLVGFYLARKTIQSYAVSVSHSVADSEASADNVHTLQTIQKELTEQQSAVVKASEIAAPSSTYQNQVITDIDTYATLADVQVQNFGFSAPVAGTTAPTTATAGGITSPTSTVIVTIGSPVAYTNLLEFIQEIENNLPKMQISSINISRSVSGSDSNLVTTDTLTIEVFTE